MKKILSNVLDEIKNEYATLNFDPVLLYPKLQANKYLTDDEVEFILEDKSRTQKFLIIYIFTTLKSKNDDAILVLQKIFHENNQLELLTSIQEKLKAIGEEKFIWKPTESGAASSVNEPRIAKSSIILNIKPWDQDTDLNEIERRVRLIAKDGLLWSKEVKILPIAFGIKMLQMGCVVEDDKVNAQFLEEEILEIEDLVQSVDVAANNEI